MKRDQEIGSDSDKEKESILPVTTQEIQTMLWATHQYYQSKSDTTD